MRMPRCLRKAIITAKRDARGRPKPWTLREAADAALKYGPLVASAVFVLTNYVLVLIFSEWGLPYTQLVGAGDLATLGFLVGFFAVLVPCLAMLPCVLIDFVAFWTAPTWRGPIAACGLLVTSGIAISAWWLGDLGQKISFHAAWIALGIGGHVLRRASDYDRHQLWRILTIVPSLAVFLIIGGLWFQLSIQLFTSAGFVGGRWTAKTEKTPCAGQVMWLGDKTTVIRCEAKPKTPSKYVVMAHDDLVITPPPVRQNSAIQTAK